MKWKLFKFATKGALLALGGIFFYKMGQPYNVEKCKKGCPDYEGPDFSLNGLR